MRGDLPATTLNFPNFQHKSLGGTWIRNLATFGRKRTLDRKEEFVIFADSIPKISGVPIVGAEGRGMPPKIFSSVRHCRKWPTSDAHSHIAHALLTVNA